MAGPAMTGPAMWEMVAPVLAGSSVSNEDEKPSRIGGGYRPTVNRGDTSGVRLNAAQDARS